jgi:hypothetical protein
MRLACLRDVCGVCSSGQHCVECAADAFEFGSAPGAGGPRSGRGCDLTLDEVLPLLRKALNIAKPRLQLLTIGGGLRRSAFSQRRKNCALMTAIWMGYCGFATNETDRVARSGLATRRRGETTGRTAARRDGRPHGRAARRPAARPCGETAARRDS